MRWIGGKQSGTAAVEVICFLSMPFSWKILFCFWTKTTKFKCNYVRIGNERRTVLCASLLKKFCLQWSEISQYDQKAGASRTPEWTESLAVTGKLEQLGKPKPPEWSSPTYCPNVVTCVNIRHANWNSFLKRYFLDFFTEFGSMDNWNCIEFAFIPYASHFLF
jgi:hypothetical protein